MGNLCSDSSGRHSSDNRRDNPRLSVPEAQSRSVDHAARPPENNGAQPSVELQRLRRRGGVAPDNPRDNLGPSTTVQPVDGIATRTEPNGRDLLYTAKTLKELEPLSHLFGTYKRVPWFGENDVQYTTITENHFITGKPFIRDSKDMIHVEMGSYGVTKADYKYPMLKTYGVSSCVGLVLYEPSAKLVGLSHIVSGTEHEAIKALLKPMHDHGLTEKGKETLQASIIGGLDGEAFLDAMYEQPFLAVHVEKALNQLGVKNIIFKEYEDTHNRRDIAVDSRIHVWTKYKQVSMHNHVLTSWY